LHGLEVRIAAGRVGVPAGKAPILIETEPSSVSPTARVLIVHVGRTTVKVDGRRSHIGRFAKALAEQGDTRLDEH
jgi:hypothetical protein